MNPETEDRLIEEIDDALAIAEWPARTDEAREEDLLPWLIGMLEGMPLGPGPGRGRLLGRSA